MARYHGSAYTTGLDEARDITVDAEGNAYVTGYSDNPEYGYYRGDYATVKYDPAGTEVWAARYDSPINGWDQARAVALDDAGNVYVAGETPGPNSWDYTTVKYGQGGSTAPPPPTQSDTVSITKAEYDSRKAELSVEADGSDASATLTVRITATDDLIGTLQSVGGGRFRGKFPWPANPVNITAAPREARRAHR